MGGAAGGIGATARAGLTVAVIAAGMALAHWSQRAADLRRFGNDDPESWVQPDGRALRVAAMGQRTLAADVVWVRSLLYFAETLDRPTPLKRQWQRASLEAVTTLDPGWRTPYFYGGSFLRLLGDIDGSDVILKRGMAWLPGDAYFPFAVGMNAFLYRDDPDTAARYVAFAAELPGAPDWYRSAAAGILEGHGQRRAALRYLDEQLALADRPAAIEALLRKKRDLVHDELVSLFAERRAALLQERGADIQRPEDLGELPPDPHGAGWIIAPDGVVRSAAAERALAARLMSKERRTVLRRP
jgi:hypothetical protein